MNYFIEKYFRDKKLGNIGFDFSDKPNRLTVVQKIIETKTSVVIYNNEKTYEVRFPQKEVPLPTARK